MTNLSVDNFVTNNFQTQQFNSTSISGDAIYDNGKRVATNESVDQKIAEIPSYTLSVATSTRLGGVKINGNNLAILADGTLSAAAGGGGSSVSHSIHVESTTDTVDMSTITEDQWNAGEIILHAQSWESKSIKIDFSNVQSPALTIVFYNNIQYYLPDSSYIFNAIGTDYGFYSIRRLKSYGSVIITKLVAGSY